jgi:Fe-S-cluster containining protein
MAAQGDFSNEFSNTLSCLLTEITALKQALEALPIPSDGGYYRALVGELSIRLPPLYRAYDAHLTAVLITEGRMVTCSRGCSACCRHFVSSVEPFELIALDHHIKSRQNYGDLVVSAYRKSTLYETILRDEETKVLGVAGDSSTREASSGDGVISESGADERDAEAMDRSLYRYFLRGQRCSFLESDGTCGVYEWRPMACRMFYAESSPRFCAGKELASPWNKNFQVELPQEAEEALARCSRLLEHLQLSENLFSGITEVNALFGRHEALPPEGQPENPVDPSTPPPES